MTAVKAHPRSCSVATLACCVLAALAITTWASQDKQGQVHIERLWDDPGPVLFFSGPYLLMATSACVAWRRRALSRSVLLATVVIMAIQLPATWLDLATYRKTPPGREEMPIIGFIATLFAWFGAILILFCVAGRRILSWRRAAEGEPVPAED